MRLDWLIACWQRQNSREKQKKPIVFDPDHAGFGETGTLSGIDIKRKIVLVPKRAGSTRRCAR